MQPKISIIIPTLNEEYSLPLLLTSLTKQQAKNFEVIIVDGISEDSTKESALKFSKLLPIHFYEVKRNNVAFQRNYGVKKAQGTYIIFLDADSIVTPPFTKIAEKYISEIQNTILIPYIVPDKRTLLNNLIFFIANKVIELAQIVQIPLSSGATIILDKEIFLKTGGYSEDLFVAEDHDLLHKFQKQRIKSKMIKNLKVIWSLRRYRKEGYITVFYKYSLSGIQRIIFGKVKKKSYEYEMGGHIYSKQHYYLDF